MTPATIVMATSSYPRFEGDGIGSFVEPIAHGIAARGHEVHVVAPWHPLIRRPNREGRVHFHFFRYAPIGSLNLFGYAAALKADIQLRPATYLVTPLALAAWRRRIRRVVQQCGASVLHAHWVVPGGFLASITQSKIPIVISLHGSDVFVAETNRLARTAARYAFERASWVTACSNDLRKRAIAIGARADHTEVVPYGVDTSRFRPDLATRTRMRQQYGIADEVPVVIAAGRLVRKKGFEYLIESLALLKARWPTVTLLLAGGGDLESELRTRVGSLNIADRVLFLGSMLQGEIAALLSAADIAVVPSVHDDAGNVDGLPNIFLEALASGTPVVTTAAGGIASVVSDGETARIVPERDPEALAASIEELLRKPELAGRLGSEARAQMCRQYSWAQVAQRFEAVYLRAGESMQEIGAGRRRNH